MGMGKRKIKQPIKKIHSDPPGNPIKKVMMQFFSVINS